MLDLERRAKTLHRPIELGQGLVQAGVDHDLAPAGLPCQYFDKASHRSGHSQG
jgi:hypothetical protein